MNHLYNSLRSAVENVVDKRGHATKGQLRAILEAHPPLPIEPEPEPPAPPAEPELPELEPVPAPEHGPPSPVDEGEYADDDYATNDYL